MLQDKAKLNEFLAQQVEVITLSDPRQLQMKILVSFPGGIFLGKLNYGLLRNNTSD